MTLDAYLEQAPVGAVNRLAERVGVTATTISKWRYGSRTPSLKDALKIESATDGLVTPAELTRGKAARRRKPLVPRKHPTPKTA